MERHSVGFMTVIQGRFNAYSAHKDPEMQNQQIHFKSNQDWPCFCNQIYFKL